MKYLKLFALIFAITGLIGCESNNAFVADTGGVTPTDPGSVVVSTVTLITDKTSISTGTSTSGTNEFATLTAIVKDSNNNLAVGVPVTFNVNNSGSLEVVSGTTDSTGTATARLYATGDATNRLMTVSATSGGVSDTVDVTATGTTLRLSTSTPTVSLGQAAVFSITAEDGTGNPVSNASITVSSTSNNAISPSASVFTSGNGTVDVTVSGDNAGIDTITATGLGTATNTTLTVGTAASFSLANASGLTDIAVGAIETITLTWLNAQGSAVPAKPVNFALSRGIIVESGTATHSGSTNASGQFSFTIQSNNAGPVTISAIAAAPETASTVLELNFAATVPAKIDLQPNPSTIGTEETSTVTAVVRDANNNPVKGVNVAFSVDDITSGSISPALATTDSLGRASTVYTSSQLPSGGSAVVVTATVQSFPGITTTADITVAEKSFFISMGTGKTITSVNSTTNAMPFTVTVSDIYGHGVPDVNVLLSARPIQPGPNNLPNDPLDSDSKAYAKGGWVVDTVEDAWVQVITAYCNNEDVDLNGVLDPGEDTDLDEKLDPATNLVIPSFVTTDADGIATFNLQYAKEFAHWVGVELYATITTSGTDNVYKKVFWLPGVAADYSDTSSAVPGEISPFGTVGSCSDYR